MAAVEPSPAPVSLASVTHGECANVGALLARIGDRWTMRAVMALAEGPRRFNELRRALDGVSQRMLTLTLRGLERDGLVHRMAFPTVPPRVDYTLTPLGRSLAASVAALGQWAVAHTGEMNAARARYDEIRAAHEG